MRDIIGDRGEAVVYLDPEEYRSTWLGNKAIFRLRLVRNFFITINEAGCSTGFTLSPIQDCLM